MPLRPALAPPYPRRRRLGMRLAAGLTPVQAARSEGTPVAEVEGLLAEPAFLELVAVYRAIEALPPAERVARLGCPRDGDGRWRRARRPLRRRRERQRPRPGPDPGRGG